MSLRWRRQLAYKDQLELDEMRFLSQNRRHGGVFLFPFPPSIRSSSIIRLGQAFYFFLFTFSFLLLFNGCASLKYPPSYPMTREIVRSLQGGITVQVPQGWFNSTDSNVAPGLLLWLVKKDYTAAITLTEFHADEIGNKQLTTDGLETLASISFSLKKEHVQQAIQMIETYEIFTLNGRKFCAYEYSTDQGRTIERVIVFGGIGRWFEISAVPFQKKGRFIDHESLFTVQNSLLNTLRF